MKTKASISIYLDTRRSKASGKFPVKLRVFTSEPRKQKLYPTKFEFTKAEFYSIWETSKPRKKYHETRDELEAIRTLAKDVNKKLNFFTFDQFEKKLFRGSSSGNNVFYMYDSIINKLIENDQHNTASIYNVSLKSIKDFIKYSKGKSLKRLSFIDVTPEWLEKYEHYMINHLNRSRTTVSMYLRNLRTVFNVAIREKEIDSEVYPFGKNKYVIPAVRAVKKSLTKDQLKRLHESKPDTPDQVKAKEFWFFSYICNGMNIKDIALLRHKDIKGDYLSFYRAKTINTSKASLRPIVVYLTDLARNVILKYGNSNANPDQYIFKIINNNMSELEKQKRINNFTRFINQHLKKIALANDLPFDISTYWARHSYSTSAIRKGASMEYVSEALGHSNLSTTKGYFAGFEDDKKKEIANKLLEF